MIMRRYFQAIAILSVTAAAVMSGGVFALHYQGGSGAVSRQPVVWATWVPPAEASVDMAGPSRRLPQADDATLRLVAVGDIMLSRNVAAQIRKFGWDYPFAGERELLKSGDIVFGNLEAPIIAGPIVKTGDMVFHADPGAENALRDAGFTVLSLANNHLPNYGAAGIRETLTRLKKAGIAASGAGKDLAEAAAPALVAANGRVVAFLSYNDNDVVPASYGARDDHPGTNLMDRQRLPADLAAIRDKADIVIVSMHSGTEYVPGPNKRQTAFAHAAIEAGADMVIGHHPHVVQSAEIYRGKPIFYSLGNFAFDQLWSEETKRGIILVADFDRRGLRRIGLVPLCMKDYGRPETCDETTAAAIIARLGLTVEKTPEGRYILSESSL